MNFNDNESTAVMLFVSSEHVCTCPINTRHH